MSKMVHDSPKNPTARSHVVAVLTQEILDRPDEKDFLIGSEHQLCRQFAVSRVTVRLALGDLENLGFIYRRHGKGTFAYGRSNRPGRSVAILITSSDILASTSFIEILRGAHSITSSLQSGLVLMSASPLGWQPDLVRSLGGVVVMNASLAPQELEVFKDRNIPYLLLEEANLNAMRCDFFNLGQRAVHALKNAVLTRESNGEIKIEEV
jgi:DNA-binding transcriptional regulator YhcF (GntR family)